MLNFKNNAIGEEFAAESLVAVGVNMFLCIVMLIVVSWFYKKYSRSLGGKTHVGAILPLIGLTVFLIIVVVKSSLALSLGLVGALSIVRFRTPIKEPEELGYLFLTIAVGLGFGAGFKIVTAFVTTTILGYLWLVRNKNSLGRIDGEYMVVVSFAETGSSSVENITEGLKPFVLGLKLTRIDCSSSKIVVYYTLSLAPDFKIQSVINKLKEINNTVDIQMVEQGINW